MQVFTVTTNAQNTLQHFQGAGLYLSDFHWGGLEFRLDMTDRATIAGMEVAKLVMWNSLLN